MLRIYFIILDSAVLAASVCAAGEKKTEPEYSAYERGHWSFQVPKRPAIPIFRDTRVASEIESPVDAFLLRKLQSAKLRFSPPASRRVLVRRLYFDLIGLPPTPNEIDAFVNDKRPDAWPRLVERLLADPRYGERWAQHWLDVIRYAESEGFEYDRHRPGLWRFRDYVIRSFNADKPYDRFVTEQIAGDELQFTGSPAQKLQSPAFRDARIAVAFHRLGPVRRNAGNADVAFSRNEVLTEMTDAVGSTFLGMTIGCARCHDHKFDPIRQKDYYRLEAFLASTHEHAIPLADADDRKRWKQEKAKVDREIARIKAAIRKASGSKEQALRAKLAAAEARMPAPLPQIFTARNKAEARTPIHLLIRGDEFKKGTKLGMRLPGVFLPERSPELKSGVDRPKTRLANWIANPGNPLTARVMANRIWQYHFGTGLVETSNDFGANGSDPSHPQLLDWLATEFVRSGWSVKTVHRRILLSRAYRQKSQTTSVDRGQTIDPRNRLLWRFPRKRLDAEQLRDAMLQIAGLLYRKAGGRSVMIPVDRELVDLLYKPSQWRVTPDPREHNRRSIYLFAKRNLRVPFLEVFDQPDLQISCFRRTSSTHAPQALELLNGRFSNRIAKAFATRLRREAGDNPDKIIRRGYLLTAGREPTPAERQLCSEFLRTQPLDEFALAMLNLNGFLYVE